MDKYCCVQGCLKTSDDGVKLHEFPFANDLLLPIWIMATNREDWLPTVNSRICDSHFSIVDYEDGNKKNMLKSNACPLIQTENTEYKYTNTLRDFEANEFTTTNDFNCSDVESGRLLDTPNTSDMKSSDDDSRNFYETSGPDDSYLTSVSDCDLEPENEGVEESVQDCNSTVSITSSIISLGNTNPPINNVCAVVLCNQHARDHFETLFFINFPKDNTTLCDIWWKICGREENFDPSFKICSIHFNIDDFTTVTVKREGQLFKQTILKNNNIVPSLYLLSHEYSRFIRKRKRNAENNDDVQKNSTEIDVCIVQGCEKTLLKDGKQTLFFKFPLNSKAMLKKWVHSLGFPKWQPTVTARVCSDHFENHDVLMNNNVYALNNDAIPSIKPQNPFVLWSEDNHDEKNRFAANKKNIDSAFDSLEYDHLEVNSLIVKDLTKEKNNKCKMLNSSENKLDDLELKHHKKLLKTSTTQFSSTKINENKELTDECNQTKLVSKPKKIILRKVNIDASNITALSKIKAATKIVVKSPKESTPKYVPEEKNTILKSRNNGNDCDSIAKHMLEEDESKTKITKRKNVLTDECNQTKLVSKPKKIILRNVNIGASNINALSKNKVFAKVVMKSPKESIPKYIPEEKNVILKSRSNGNDSDSIAKDMSEDDEPKTKITKQKNNQKNELTDECNQTKLVSKPKKIILRKVNIDASNITALSKIKATTNAVMKSPKESTPKYITEEKNTIPKSRNNGNNCDSIDIDTLEDDDVKNMSSLAKKSTPKNFKTKIMIQSKKNQKNVLTDECNQTKLVSKPDKISLRKVNTGASNINSIPKNKGIAKVVKKSIKESIPQNIPEGKFLIPKSSNSGNDSDYIYLDMLEGEDAIGLMSFETRSVPKNSNLNLLKLLEKNKKKGIPESIIGNQNLIECYDEMLPPHCDHDCQLLCFNSIPGPERRQIYKEFQTLNHVTEQNCKITQLIQLRVTKKIDGTFESRPIYNFTVNREIVKVCRTFFTNTLGIPNRRLDAILNPINYSWYFDRDTALKANLPNQVRIISEPVIMTDFMKKSVIPLGKDYNFYESESDSEVTVDNVSFKEYEKVFLHIKSIPRVLSSYQNPGTSRRHFFETSISVEYMYKTYSENYIKNKTSPPFTKRQFKKIYNSYMKTFLKFD